MKIFLPLFFSAHSYVSLTVFPSVGLSLLGDIVPAQSEIYCFNGRKKQCECGGLKTSFKLINLTENIYRPEYFTRIKAFIGT